MLLSQLAIEEFKKDYVDIRNMMFDEILRKLAVIEIELNEKMIDLQS